MWRIKNIIWIIVNDLHDATDFASYYEYFQPRCVELYIFLLHVARSRANIQHASTAPTLKSKLGRGGQTITDGTRNGVDIRVIQERNGDIVTGFPTNVPRNPR